MIRRFGALLVFVGVATGLSQSGTGLGKSAGSIALKMAIA
jgi:hypothetical protein